MHRGGRAMRTLALLGSILIAAPAGAQEKQILGAPGANLGLPFTPAIRIGDVIYLSGQIGNVPGTRNLVPGGTAAEVRQTLTNIKALLEQSGSSMDRVFKCTVFLTDINDYTAMNEVYTTFFPKDPPARSTVAVTALALGAKTEIECVALAGK